jgi:hypothetical protein
MPRFRFYPTDDGNENELSRIRNHLGGTLQPSFVRYRGKSAVPTQRFIDKQYFDVNDLHTMRHSINVHHNEAILSMNGI